MINDLLWALGITAVWIGGMAWCLHYIRRDRKRDAEFNDWRAAQAKRAWVAYRRVLTAHLGNDFPGLQLMGATPGVILQNYANGEPVHPRTRDLNQGRLEAAEQTLTALKARGEKLHPVYGIAWKVAETLNTATPHTKQDGSLYVGIQAIEGYADDMEAMLEAGIDF